MHHIGYDQNNLRKNYQNDDANNAGDKKIARTFENCRQVYFGGQGFDHKYINPYRWRYRTHGGYHGNNDGKPDRIETQGFSQREKNGNGQNQKSKGIDETAANQINQQYYCQNSVGLHRQRCRVISHHKRQARDG